MRFGVLCLVLSTVLWAFSSIFMKFFSQHQMDAAVQNLFRYAFAALALWAVALPVFGRELTAALRQWRRFLLPTFFNCVFQVTAVSALYRSSIFPGLSSLLSKSSIVFSCVLAFILFREERSTILSRRYLAGCLLAVLGVAGVVMFAGHARADFPGGVALVLLASFCWACYTLSMKRVVGSTRPLVTFTIVSTWTTLFFVAQAFLVSSPRQFFAMPASLQALLALSGVACISAAHSLYFRAVERLGVAVCASFLLVQPLITGVASALLFSEELTTGQVLSGAFLLGGGYLVVRSASSAPQRQAGEVEPTEAVGG